MSNYNPIVSSEDPLVSIQLPANIVKDLARRSIENGHTLTMEMSIRLAHSLERDLAMIAEDNQVAVHAMEIAQKMTSKKAKKTK